MEKKIFGDRKGANIQVSRKICSPKLEERYPTIVNVRIL